MPPATSAPGSAPPAFPAVAFGILAAAIALWIVSLHQVDLHRISDVGLISALPASYFVAIALLTIGFFRLLGRPERPAWLMWAHLITAVLFLHGVTGFVESTPRFPTAWVHAGFAEQIMRHHTTLPGLDARFSWPGFFSAAALVSSVGGVSPLWFLRWAPVAVNLGSLVALAAIVRSAGVGDRAQWLALWFFCVANWVGQDYFSPQALGFLLFLAFVAVLLRFFRPDRNDVPGATWLTRRTPDLRIARAAASLTTMDEPVDVSEPASRVALIAVLLAVAAATIVAHQLTPFALVAVTAALVVGRRTTLDSLPVLLVAAAVAWISFGAKTYWQGHLGDVTGGIGRLGAAVGSGLGQRLRGSAGHVLVVRCRLVVFAGLWALAAVGAGRMVRRGRLPWTFALAAAAPLSLALVQSYGGEILLRIYLFSLPFLALLAALAFVPAAAATATATAGRGLVAAAAVSLVLTGLFVLIRYGNERFESFTTGEVAAVDYVYAHAQPGDRIVAANPSLPWEEHDIGRYTFIGQIDRRWIDDGTAIVGYLRPQKGTPTHGGYLILTRSEGAYGEIVEGRRAGWLDGVEQRALATGEVQIAFQNQDATVLWRPATGVRA